MSTQPYFGELALGSDDVGNLHLIAVGTDSHLYLAATQTVGDGDWHVAQTNALAFQQRQFNNVAVGRGNGGRLQVVGLGTNRDPRLYLAAWLDLDGIWKAPPFEVPSPLGDPGRQYLSVAAVNGFSDNLYIVAMSEEQRLFNPAFQDRGGYWVQPQTQGPLGNLQQQYLAFALARGYADDLQLVALGTDGRLYLVAFQDNRNGDWLISGTVDNPIGGIDHLYTTLAAARGRDGALRVLALDAGGRLYEAAYQEAARNVWHATALPLGNPGAVYTSLSLSPGPQDTLQAICLGTDGAAYTAAYLDAGGNWHAGDAASNPLGGRSDRQYLSLVPGTGYHRSLQVVALETRPNFGTPYLAAYLDADGNWQPGRSLAPGRPERWNPRMIDVTAAFDAVPDHGVDHELSGDPPYIDEPATHIQGLAQYAGYYLLTHNREREDTGLILVYDVARGVYLESFPTAFEGFRHPGGGQVIGDYMAVPVERDSPPSSFVSFYYVGLLAERSLIYLQPAQIRRDESKAGAVGITDVGAGAERHYIVAVYDSPTVSIYRSNTYPLDDARCEFTALFTANPGGRGADNLCLVTDIDDNVYLIGLTSTDEFKLPTHDWAELYRVDFDNQRFVPIRERHMYTTSGTVNAVHFRWGAGLTIASDRRLRFYCTQRHLYLGLHIDTFG